jgi:hypothetical protein
MDRVNAKEDNSDSVGSSRSSIRRGTAELESEVVNKRRSRSSNDSSSQDETKSESANITTNTGMSLRDRSKKLRPNYRFPVADEPIVSVERRPGPRVSKVNTAGGSVDVSHWLQCDACQKWRIVSHVLFEDLKRLSRFECRNLQGVTCKDRDDWGSAGASEDTSVKDEGAYRRKARKNVKRINIFAGKYIPGFAGEFSDFGDD